MNITCVSIRYVESHLYGLFPSTPYSKHLNGNLSTLPLHGRTEQVDVTRQVILVNNLKFI